jgi:HK97 gp10 family phage protein
MIEAKLQTNRFPEIKALLKKRVAAQILASAKAAVILAQQMCPVSAKDHADGTPHMRDTIAVTRTIGGVVQIVVGDPAAAFVEFGTHKMAAQPFNTRNRAHESGLKTKLNGILEKGGQV